MTCLAAADTQIGNSYPQTHKRSIHTHTGWGRATMKIAMKRLPHVQTAMKSDVSCWCRYTNWQQLFTDTQKEHTHTHRVRQDHSEDCYEEWRVDWRVLLLPAIQRHTKGTHTHTQGETGSLWRLLCGVTCRVMCLAAADYSKTHKRNTHTHTRTGWDRITMKITMEIAMKSDV